LLKRVTNRADLDTPHPQRGQYAPGALARAEGNVAMNLTISLDEPLAAQLQREASARRLAPEQVARELLGRALGKMAEAETWHQLNRRRADLIRMSRDRGLTVEERKELDELQAAVDQRLSPMDQQLLAAAEQFRQLAEGLPDATNP